MVYGQKKGREKIKGDREGKGLKKRNKGREREKCRQRKSHQHRVRELVLEQKRERGSHIVQANKCCSACK